MADQYTITPNNLLYDKLGRLTGKTLYIYLLLRSLLRYRKGTIIPVDNIVVLSYKDMLEEHGIDGHAYNRAVKQLMGYGLIEKIQGRYGGRIPTRYRIL